MIKPNQAVICKPGTDEPEHFLTVRKGATRLAPFCGASKGKENIRFFMFHVKLSCVKCDAERLRWCGWWDSVERREANGGVG